MFAESTGWPFSLRMIADWTCLPLVSEKQEHRSVASPKFLVTVISISGIWGASNTVILTGCNSLKGDGTKFSLIYESALWQKAVADWRSLMNEQRQL